MRGPPSRYDLDPAPAGFAYSARRGACRVAARARAGRAGRTAARAKRWAASPRKCRRCQRIRRATSPPPMAGRCVPAISSARRPIRRCRWRHRRSGSRPATPCPTVATAWSIPMPSIRSGPMAQVLAEAIPGQGVRRIGGDIAAGSSSSRPGSAIRPLDLLIARAAGLEDIERAPSAAAHRQYSRGFGQAVTAELIAESARAAGAEVVMHRGRRARCGIDCATRSMPATAIC